MSTSIDCREMPAGTLGAAVYLGGLVRVWDRNGTGICFPPGTMELFETIEARRAVRGQEPLFLVRLRYT